MHNTINSIHPSKLTDYSKWVTWNWSDSIDKNVPHPFSKIFTPYLQGMDAQSAMGLLHTLQAFSGNVGNTVKITTCPYCHTQLEAKQGDNRLEGDCQRNGIITAINLNRHVCTNCGWWYIEKSVTENNYISQNITYSTIFYEGIINRFSIEELNIPMETLRIHLNKHPENLHNLNPITFEKLVASIFSDFFYCHAKHVGRTGDGGIDVYAVISDKPCLVQVKRRRDPHKAEPVSTVRELMGTLACENEATGYVVTTAGDFSKQAKHTAANPNLRRYGIKLELVSKSELLEMLNISQDRITRVWEQIENNS